MRKQRFAKITEILLIVLLALLAPALTFGFGQEEKSGTKGGEKAEAGDTASKTADYKEPSQLKELIDEDKEPHILVDVRTIEEFFRGHIPTAVNIPVQIIKENPPEVPRDRLVILYCRTGNRSAQAEKILSNLGYSRVVDFGGINSWPYELEVP